MTLPPLSILCLTYGRTACVREILECYRRCEYDGTLELLLLNDEPQQTLFVDHVFGKQKTVSVINRGERYTSLGAKRNEAVMQADHDHFLFVDDDDLFLPWYPQDMMLAFQVWNRPTYPNAYLFGEGRGVDMELQIKQETHPGSYLAPKRHLFLVGGYPPVYVKGDQYLRAKLHTTFACRADQHPKPCKRPGYIYRWGNGTYHISGNPDHATAWARTHADLQQRMDRGEEPDGFIPLFPEWEIDYALLAAGAPMAAPQPHHQG